MEDVKQDDVESQASVKADETAEEAQDVSPEEGTQQASEAPGEKTDPALLLKSLQEERERRKKAEQELEQAKSSASSEDDYEDEEVTLRKQLYETNQKLGQIERDRIFDQTMAENPLLKDNKAEFEEFLERDENQNISIPRAAKLFITENELEKKARKGLETETGGERTPVQTGSMSAADVENLRKNNYRKYMDMLKKGQLKNIK